MSNDDMMLLGFKAISNFTCELSELFGDKQKSLKLYARLIKATTLNHDVAIKKHFDAFRKFCIENRDAIMEKNHANLTGNVTYSDRVYINLINIFQHADAETKSAIWKHILIISALVDPAGKAKQVLREQQENKESSGGADFLSNLISKVEAHIDTDANANPMQAVQSIMASGVFTELVGGMNDGLSNGTLDIGKLMGTVQGMMGAMNGGGGSAPDMAGMMGMLSGMKMPAPASAASASAASAPKAKKSKIQTPPSVEPQSHRRESPRIRDATPSPPKEK
jgi:hypothetical protein